jgi:hypothetical protein
VDTGIRFAAYYLPDGDAIGDEIVEPIGEPGGGRGNGISSSEDGSSCMRRIADRESA